jgi:hypothetical protein
MTLDELQAMTDEEMDARIAELRGWKREIRRSYRETPGWFHPNGVSLFDNPPSFTRDLNACAEFEKTFPSILEVAEYQEWLEKVTDVNREPVWHATARQRCMAFLLTKGAQP